MFGYPASSWNILGGFAGQLSLGHAAFLNRAMLFAPLCISGFRRGLACLLAQAWRQWLLWSWFQGFKYGLRGPFFALVTIAFAEILRLLALFRFHRWATWATHPAGQRIHFLGIPIS